MSASEERFGSHSLSTSQIEQLQNLIRQFKILGRRFSESNIPKLIEAHALSQHQNGGEVKLMNEDPVTTSSNSFNQVAIQQLQQAPPLSNNNFVSQPLMNTKPAVQPLKPQTLPHQAPKITQLNINQSSKLSISALNGASVNEAPPVPVQPLSLSWQCFHSLLLFGNGRPALDGNISFPPTDVGCFSKGAFLPLVITVPSVAADREELLKMNLLLETHKAKESGGSKLSVQSFYLQRTLRAALLKSYVDNRKKETTKNTGEIVSASNSLSSNYFSEFVSVNSNYRSRKQTRREIKNWERDDRRKRVDLDERKRKKQSDYFKSLMDHRDAFLKFHKSTKTETSKLSKVVRSWVESLDLKKERDEARIEMKRLQALKENDMEAYTSLVQETKNGRLKFLLNETDNYIATINRMIQQQRVQSNDSDMSDEVNESDASFPGGEKITKTAKDYYRCTHRTLETVTQPRMLIGGDLKEYQMSGLQWLVSLYNNNLNGILADEMGLGKTIQTIALLSYLMEFKNNNGPFLIVVPLSTLSNWVNEFNKWAPDIIKVVYKGTPEERRKILKEEIESRLLNVLITTYEYIMKDKSSLRKLTWQYIVVDEGHRMKNAQSKFAQTLGNFYQSKHRILLTGTPLQNNLPELWALLNFLLPTIFSSVDTFDQWFNKPFAAFRNQTANTDENNGEINILTQEERMLIVHRLHEVLRPFVLRRVKDQVLDQLPEKIEKVLRCSLSGWQKKMYRSITMKGLSNKDGTFGGLNNTIMQLRKVCNHPYLFIRDYVIDEDLIRASGKFELLDRMLPKLKAAGHRVLIFSQMVEVMNFLEQFFMLKNFNFLRLDGNTAADEREKRMFAFNDPYSPYFIFLLSTRAGGLGLNLATADTVIIFDSDWNPMVDAQAQDRAHRIGQRNEVRVFRLLTNSSIEERILAKATDKLNLTGLVVEAGKFNARGSNTLDDNKELMESLLKEWSEGGAEVKINQSSMNDYEGQNDDDVPDDDQLNEMMASYEGELELYQNLDKERQTISHSRSKLMEANEIPMWLTENCWPQKYAILMNDMMTIQQEIKTPKKKGRKRKDFENENIVEDFAFENTYDDNEEDDDDDGDEVESVNNVIGGKLMRKRKDVKYDDGMTDFQFVKALEKKASEENQEELSKKRGKRSLSHLEPVYQELLKSVQDVQKIKRTDGTLLAELFLEKPLKSLYPDYYQIIPIPISLKEICQKLRSGEYVYFENIELDFALMSDNARIFNTEQSPVFTICDEIRKEFYLRTERVREKYGIHSLSDKFGGFTSLPKSGPNIFSDGMKFVGLLKAEAPTSKKLKLEKNESTELVLSISGSGAGKNNKDENKLILSIESITNYFTHQNNMRQLEESDSGSKPLATTFLQEFQNLKDKFKNEDDSYEKESPYQHLEKATVLQESRIFHDASVVTQNPRRCCQMITKLLFLLVKGETFSSAEVTEVFFGVTKLFQSDDVNLRRMMYLFIKEIAETCNPDDVIIVTSSLTKDMNIGEDLYRANSMRVLAKIIDSTMLGAIERYLKQAIVDRNAFVASSALMSGIRLFKSCPEVVRRWINEVQEAVNSSSDMVQYHALSLLYKIKQHDRLAVSKIVQQLSKGSLRSPLATCLLIRYTSNLLHEDMNSTNAKASYQFLEACLRHKNEMVIYESAKAICSLPGVESNDLSPAITVLQLFLSSHKPSLRFAAMRTLSEVAVNHPISVAKCNDDMESLVSDSNRSIATLAITTLLKTGAEASIERLMKQISTFMAEIGDEFKIVVVKAIRELCLKYPKKHRVMVGFLATFLREEGGFEFKKSIVDSIVDLMNAMPETKESSLLHLCEFIEDCEFTELIVQIMHIVGSVGPTTSSPSRYIRFVFNRLILENSMVRAAAVSTLGAFATTVPDVRSSCVALLSRSLVDEDDEVRDRAVVILRALQDSDKENEARFILAETMPMSFSALERSLKAVSANISAMSINNLTFSHLPIIDDSAAVASLRTAMVNKKKNLPGQPEEQVEMVDQAAAIYKIPQFSHLGRVFRSTAEVNLTETEMEYVVGCTKHIFAGHIVLQFSVLNTIDDQLLQNVKVNVEVANEEAYVVESIIPASAAKYGERAFCYVCLKKLGDPSPTTFSCELQFKLVHVDPATGAIESKKGYDEDFPLEDLEICTNDFMAKVSVGDFRKAWDQMGTDGEVLSKFALQFKRIDEAINAVADFLGMQVVDGTGTVASDIISSKKPHMLHLSGVFIGNFPILVRAQLQMDDTNSVVLKIAVRSNNKDISQLVAECING